MKPYQMYFSSALRFAQNILVLKTLVFIFNAEGIEVISSPTVTAFGDWGSWQYCPNGTYATGFQLKVEKLQGSGGRRDDTALNAIALYCNKLGEHSRSTWISSSQGDFGEWRSVLDCQVGGITGFQLRSEGDENTIEDATAANNLKVYCGALGIAGDGEDRGTWTNKQSCFAKQAVCGIRTQVQRDLGTGFDNTALNNVDMACCDIRSPSTSSYSSGPSIRSPSPIKSCTPKDNWETVVSCDNYKGISPLRCSFTKSRGVKLSGSEISSHRGNSFVGADMQFLKSSFSATVGTSWTTGHSWTTEKSESFSQLITESAEFQVPPGVKSELRQIVGYCGKYTVYTTYFDKIDTTLNSLDGAFGQLIDYANL